MSRTALLKLVCLFGLSLAVVACGGDSNNPPAGGSGGNGGSAGSGGSGGSGTPVDQCVNEPDKGYVESGALSAAAQNCGQGACVALMVELITGEATEEKKQEAADCITECVLEDSDVDGVSEGCAQCFGTSSACGADAGCNVCIEPDSCACVDCLESASCQTQIDMCTGVIREFNCTP